MKTTVEQNKTCVKWKKKCRYILCTRKILPNDDYFCLFSISTQRHPPTVRRHHMTNVVDTCKCNECMCAIAIANNTFAESPPDVRKFYNRIRRRRRFKGLDARWILKNSARVYNIIYDIRIVRSVDKTPPPGRSD